MPSDLTFHTIDLARHADLCVAWRRDTYRCGHTPNQDLETGGSGYLAWLTGRIEREPGGHVHVWRGDEIVGQLEMCVRVNDPARGHVNLFYLPLDQRGCGLGDALMDFVREFFKTRGIHVVTLNVSVNNARALAYYRKHGWRRVEREAHAVEDSIVMMELQHDDCSDA